MFVTKQLMDPIDCVTIEVNGVHQLCYYRSPWGPSTVWCCHSSKYLQFSAEERNSNGFGTT